ncbi:MAG: site-2 protease family protein [Minisyncoccia bacterium]
MIQLSQFFSIIVLLFSVVIHEVSHGWAALKLGDDTAEKMGRLTLNPIPHLDLFGSILLPLMLLLSHVGIVFGWAKPVPYNPLKLRNPARDSALLALAGPASNFVLALTFGLLIRGLNYLHSGLSLTPFLGLIVQINLVLAIFNLLPIPPLDGSHIFFYLWPFPKLEMFLYQYSFVILLIFILFGWNLIYPLISLLFHLLTGM